MEALNSRGWVLVLNALKGLIVAVNAAADLPMTDDDNRSVYRKYKIKSHTKQVHPVESSRSFESSTAPFNTPFDTKGKCHYHKDVKLAIKQMGEWKVLVEACPMCREDAIARSTSSKPRHSKEYKYVPQYDEDGYCINHSEIRIAKKKVTGSWKITNECPKCTSNDDSASAYSEDSRVTFCSVKSNKSSRSRGSRKSHCGDDVSLVMQGGRATQGQSHWSNVESSGQSKAKPKGIRRFLLASIAM